MCTIDRNVSGFYWNMALIELNVDRPAIKRVEGGTERTEEHDSDTDDSSGRKRIGAVFTVMLLVVIGVVAVKRLRNST